MKLLSSKNSRLIFLFVLVFGLFLWIKFGSAPEDNHPEYVEVNSGLVPKEECTTCHTPMRGFSKFHDPQQIGCVSCHLGNPLEEGKEEAHENMVLIPGNLEDVSQTCGKCHIQEMEKINNSLMTTNSGLVAVDKFIFGEADSPDYPYDIREIHNSAADKHLRDLCANCHLGAKKSELGKIDQRSRGGGCIACHLNYSEKAESDLAEYLHSNKARLPGVHPSVDLKISNEHCYGCHSRSSRISTNYEGWHETLLDSMPLNPTQRLKVNQDKRVYAYKGEDVHHTKGMLCIDCHSSHEVMGDGTRYLHEENAVKITCSDCHFKDQPNTLSYDQLDAESYLVWMHRAYEHQDKPILKKQKGNQPLVNTFVDEKGNAFLISKANGNVYPLSKQPEICSRDQNHDNLACATCHSQWTPKCIGCHNSFDPEDPEGYDLLDKRFVKGQWIEHVFEFETAYPALGVRKNTHERKIEPAIPGMVLSIDHPSFDPEKSAAFYRLYAPNSPHTTASKSRDCKSCHSNSTALGYGKGDLDYKIASGKGTWVFTPHYAKNPNDGLPEDAWIPFLGKPLSKPFSTRTDFYPLSVEEQKIMLTVGACLNCHPEDSGEIKSLMQLGLKEIQNKLSSQCIIPFKN